MCMHAILDDPYLSTFTYFAMILVNGNGPPARAQITGSLDLDGKLYSHLEWPNTTSHCPLTVILSNYPTVSVQSYGPMAQYSS